MTSERFISQIEATQGALRRFLTALCCGDSMLADDIAQEAFLKGYLACETLKEEGKFKSWIFRIAYTTFLNHRRSARDLDDIDDAVTVASPSETDAAFRYQDLYAALDRLPDRERTSVLLFYMEGYAVKEIAEITETTQDAVKQHLSRGRKHLRGLLAHSA